VQDRRRLYRLCETVVPHRAEAAQGQDHRSDEPDGEQVRERSRDALPQRVLHEHDRQLVRHGRRLRRGRRVFPRPRRRR
jgi:hypothetical protein